MRFTRLIYGTLISVAVLASGSRLFCTEPDQTKYGQPGAPHKQLDVFAGDWDAEFKFFVAEDAPPVVTKGRSEQKWILGGRFLQQNFEGELFGQPFSGMGLLGYDQVKQQYTAMWVDTSMTAITTSVGAFAKDGKTLTFVGQHNDPRTGKAIKTRDMTRVVDANTHTLEMYEVSADGKERKIFMITFARAKSK
jgi:hypothetical protein